MRDTTLPKHIAIIMDGNGRWAKRRFLPRIAGHQAGVKSVRKIVKHCVEKQIQVLSLFAFSSENWRRPQTEVDYLMLLFNSVLTREAKKLHKQNIRLRIIGDRAGLADSLQKLIHKVEALTENNTGLVLQIAANYGGQWDILQAVQKISQEVAAGQLAPTAVTESVLRAKLSFADLPDPDLFIRTSGEQRISNFFLWQLAYTELYFTDVLWPDFDGAALDRALEFFQNRERRFGGIPDATHSKEALCPPCES